MTASTPGTGIYVHRAKAAGSVVLRGQPRRRRRGGPVATGCPEPQQPGGVGGRIGRHGHGPAVASRSARRVPVRRQRDAVLLHPVGVPAELEHAELRAQLPGGRAADRRSRRGRSTSACTAGAAAWTPARAGGTRPSRVAAGLDQPGPVRLVDGLPREQRHDAAVDERRGQRRRRGPQLQPEARLVVRRTTSSASRWNVDPNHVLSGAAIDGRQRREHVGHPGGDKFAYIVSRVGVHIPALTPTFTGSFEGVTASSRGPASTRTPA